MRQPLINILVLLYSFGKLELNDKLDCRIHVSIRISFWVDINICR